MDFDVVVIGAGVVGSAIARELSRYDGKVLVVERAADVCEGTSKANSAIVHAGFDAVPGTLKANLNVRGNEMMDELSRDLDIPFKRVGALVCSLGDDDLPMMNELLHRARANCVPKVRVLTYKEVHALEPNLSPEVNEALYAETSGIVCPFEMTLGLAENAAKNGVEFRFNTEVTGFTRLEDGWIVHCGDEKITTRGVVNAAGCYADVLHNMVTDVKIHITPRRGEYMLLDRTVGDHVKHTIFQMPGKLGKGILVSPTVHGNLLLGPTAVDGDDRENTSTTAEGLADVMEKCALAVDHVPTRQVITSFAGLRAHEDDDDFILQESVPGFFDAAGIESPGLSSAPAIGEYMAELIAERLSFGKNPNFDPTRKGIPHVKELPFEERAELIKKNPAYGTIVCRCEEISEGEIVDAIHGILGAKTLDGVKRRTRAGMGRCQSGFCSPRVMEILSRELGIELEDVRKSGADSAVVVEKIR